MSQQSPRRQPRASQPQPPSQQPFQETVSQGQSQQGGTGSRSGGKTQASGSTPFREVVMSRRAGKGRAYPPREPAPRTPIISEVTEFSEASKPQTHQDAEVQVSRKPSTASTQPAAENNSPQTPIRPAPQKTQQAPPQSTQPQTSTQQAEEKNSGNSEQSEPSPLTLLIRRLSPIIWAVVVALVLIPLAGRLIIAKSAVPPTEILAPHQEITASLPPAKLSRLDKDVVSAIQAAHESSRNYATSELDVWLGELNPRVDSFLDWYFDYFTQKKLEISAPIVWLRSAAGNAVGLAKTTPDEAVNAKLTQEFQKEFTKRVLVPQTAQLRFEVITTEAAAIFIADLSQQMSQIQGKYRIPQGQWERYLDTIATTVNDTEGNLSNLSLKALVGGTGYLAAKPFLLTSIGKIGSKVSAKFTASATAKLATKTGTSVAAELGTSLIDPIVGVGIVIWDLWDYNSTVAVDRPLLRSNIDSYLKSMERSLLDNPETGIMAAINQLETNVVKGVKG